MSMSYFKASLESRSLGHQEFFVEFDGDEPRRQVTITRGAWIHSNPDLRRPDPNLMDQPLSAANRGGHVPISSDEFEQVWREEHSPISHLSLRSPALLAQKWRRG